MIKDAYRAVNRKKGQLLHKHRKNEMKILKLLEENSRITQDIYGLINSMDAVHFEKQKETVKD